jgi:hypothetical protein
MGMLDVIKVIWDGYNAGGSGKDIANFSASIAGLKVAEARIEQDQTSYINNKSASNVASIKASLTNIRTFLRSLDAEPLGIMDRTSMENMVNFQVSTAISNYASQLLFKIDMAINAGSLPEIDDRPWSTRRAGYVRLQNGYRMMALQFEAIVRNKRKELDNITDYESRLYTLAHSPEILKDQVQFNMIEADFKQQQADEASTRKYLTVFAFLAKASKDNYDRFTALIAAGDRKSLKR